MAQQFIGGLGGYTTQSFESPFESSMRRRGERQAGAIGKAGAGALGGLVESYNQAYQSARTANEQRYQQMLGITDQTTQQRAADVRSAYGQQQAGMMQGLARTGMAGTTVAPTMQMGVQREQQSALNRLADQMQGTKLGIMERKTDKYPDMSMIASLASMFGQGLGQAGGGGAGIAQLLGSLGNIRM